MCDRGRLLVVIQRHPLHLVELRLVNALESGERITLDDIGGAATVELVVDELRRSPLLPEVVRLVVEAMQPSAVAVSPDGLAPLLAALVGGVEDDIVLHEIVGVIDRSRIRSPLLDAQLLGGLLLLVQNHALAFTTRAFALDGAFRLANATTASRYSLLAVLVALSTDDDPRFLRLAAKIVGVAHSHWKAEGLLDLLRRLATIADVAEEALFEVGVAELSSGLDSTTRQHAVECFVAARGTFGEVLAHRPDRPDAHLYATALEGLLGFAEGASATEIGHLADRISRCAAELVIWHASDDDPPWLGARFAEMAAWRTLAVRLGTLAARLDEEAWYEPAAVIEQEILVAYTASRTMLFRDRDGGIESVVSPRIEAGAGRKRVLLQHWLKRNQGTELAGAATRLLAALEQTGSRGAPSEWAVEAPPGRVVHLPRPLESLLRLQDVAGFPHQTEIIERCSDVLTGVADYHVNSVRDLFDAVMLMTLRFLSSRMDLSVATSGRVDYLFEYPRGTPPHERRLQEDFQDFMSSMLLGILDTERPNVAGGRADVVFAKPPHRLVVEVKRELQDASFEALFRAYQGQAAEYQNTNIRLGLLLVLDLTEKPSGAVHITEQVEARLVQRPGENQRRGLVAVRVPGNRPRPSHVT